MNRDRELLKNHGTAFNRSIKVKRIREKDC